MDKLKETISIEGMSCGHCVSAVKRALAEVDGIETIDVTIGSATIEYDPECVEQASIDGAIDDAGFNVTARAAA